MDNWKVKQEDFMLNDTNIFHSLKWNLRNYSVSYDQTDCLRVPKFVQCFLEKKVRTKLKGDIHMYKEHVHFYIIYTYRIKFQG